MNQYPTQHVLELACAAHRYNKGYLKEPRQVFSSDGKVVCTDPTNRDLMIYSLVNSTNVVPRLTITDADRELADTIRKYFRKLIFAAIKQDDEFYTKLNTILINTEVAHSQLAFVACLPTTYFRDYAKTSMDRIINDLSKEHIGNIGEELLDKDCEIIQLNRSKNYDAWNVSAIIDNKLVSWMTKHDLVVGPCVVVSGKVKQHGLHWKYQCHETRLNYVKAFQ